MNDCPFCDPTRLVSPPSYFGLNGYMMMIFEPLNPVVPGHLLVAPTLHVIDATRDVNCSAAVMSVASVVASRYDSANIITSIGAPATQTVKHLHLHVVPRTEGDGLTLPWTGQHERTR